MGCELTVVLEGKDVISVSGNRCPRGEEYARAEAVEPMRVLMTLVRVEGGMDRVVSVKTDRPIPLRLFPEAMARVRELSVKAPVTIGTVVEKDFLTTGANLIATRFAR
jgi:CxxC motif-containing protein